ncbi:MAG: ethanolamine ammonia-lyase subunit EutC [Pseudomonadota bacterium]
MKEADDDRLSDSPALVQNPWAELRRLTPARLALGRAGGSLPTAEMLSFQLDHARAMDAVHRRLSVEELEQALQTSPVVRELCGPDPVQLFSEVRDRSAYLQRPDLGRRLDERSYQLLHDQGGARDKTIDIALVVADGLSAMAIELYTLPFLEAFLGLLRTDTAPWRVAPISIVSQARVAIGDDVGEALGARAVLVLIGERPGLSSPDSMGLYLTWAPRRGRHDAERNCISNVRSAGLSCEDAARKAFNLLKDAFRLEISGIGLKDRSEAFDAGAQLGQDSVGSFRLVQDSSDGDIRKHES